MIGAVLITNETAGGIEVARAKTRAGFFSRLIGLQWRRSLPAGEAAVFQRRAESRLGAAAHTCFMRFAIGLVWLNSEHVVVDMQLANPWRWIFLPQAPALMWLEGHPSILERLRVGDRLCFIEAES